MTAELEAIEAAGRLADAVLDAGGEEAAVLEDLHAIRQVLDAARDGREPNTLAAAEQAVREMGHARKFASDANLLRRAAARVSLLGKS